MEIEIETLRDTVKYLIETNERLSAEIKKKDLLIKSFEHFLDSFDKPLDGNSEA